MEPNISLIPDDLLCLIFDYLSFNDRVRLRAVCKKFHEIFDISFITTKSLDLNEGLAAFLSCSDRSFLALLESWSTTVKRIKATSRFNKWLLKSITETLFPNLIHVVLALMNQDDDLELMYQYYVNLFRRNSSIRSLTIRFGYALKFSQEIIYENLESLEIQGGRSDDLFDPLIDCDDPRLDFSSTLKSLTGRVPNLKRLVLRNENDNEDSFIRCTPEIFGLLNTVPRVETLNLSFDIDMLHKSNPYPHFGPFPFLRSLVLDLDEIYDEFAHEDIPDAVSLFNKISSHCPNLEIFKSSCICYDKNGDFCESISAFKNLRQLQIGGISTTSDGFLSIIDSCQNLRNFEIGGLKSSDGWLQSESFIDLLKSAASIVSDRKIKIRFNVWRGSEEFRIALDDAMRRRLICSP